MIAYGPADATATPSYLAAVKSRMVYLSGASLPRLSEKRLLNRCSSGSSLCLTFTARHGICYGRLPNTTQFYQNG